jgi:hypothetical protein
MKYSIFALVCVCFFGSALRVHGAGLPVKEKNPIFPTKAFIRQEHSKISDTTALYTITFTITATGERVFVPAHVGRIPHQGTSTKPGALYAISRSDTGILENGIAGGFLYSKARRVGNFFEVPRGKSVPFTAVVAYDNRGRESDEYRMNLTGIQYALRDTENTVVKESHGFSDFKTREVSLSTM